MNGKKNRLARILNPETGRGLIVAIDHGMALGPMTGLEDPTKVFEMLEPYVDAWLMTGETDGIVYKPRRHDVPQQFNLEDYAHARRPRPRALPAEWRSWSGFTEIEMGFDETMAQEEAKRCLRCDLEWLERIGEPIPVA